MITGSICKAARALVEVSRGKLAANAGVDKRAVEFFERGIHIPDDAAIAALQSALEELGALFIPEEASQGAGVRLKFNRSLTRRIDALENEGGPTAKDDVP
ncbi:XRE family transcriptional regulator [Mesorhizobium sp. PUT5]|uniref:XRE family transcriptional regulator n=1 Tax=Mesorhizobium sp. PUT5 TaxID=3454629 RepID=UPI003FA4A6D1